MRINYKQSIKIDNHPEAANALYQLRSDIETKKKFWKLIDRKEEEEKKEEVVEINFNVDRKAKPFVISSKDPLHPNQKTYTFKDETTFPSVSHYFLYNQIFHIDQVFARSLLKSPASVAFTEVRDKLDQKQRQNFKKEKTRIKYFYQGYWYLFLQNKNAKAALLNTKRRPINVDGEEFLFLGKLLEQIRYELWREEN